MTGFELAYLANPHFDAELNDSKDTVSDENDASLDEFLTPITVELKLDVFTRGFSARTVVHQGGEQSWIYYANWYTKNQLWASYWLHCCCHSPQLSSSKRKPSMKAVLVCVDPVHARSSIAYP